MPMNEDRAAPTLLLVEDSPDDLMLMSQVLKGRYRTKVTTSGERALAVLESEALPDLILLDSYMPGMDGYAVCGRLQMEARTRSIPVILLADRDKDFDEHKAFAAGAVDYITKPISAPLVLARVGTQLALKRANEQLVQHTVGLDSEVARQLHEIQQLQDGIVIALATLAEARDDETANHLRRVQHYVRATALRLRETAPQHAGELTTRHIDVIFRAVPLHDIGKVGVPDRVLLQPGPYSKAEFEQAMRHTTIGSQALGMAEKTLSYPNHFLTVARQIAQDHHERWDGSGYPRGLSRDQIPLAARLMAVADTYDALVTRRFYKNPVTHERALEIVAEGRGTQFDPDVADAFLLEGETIRGIAQKYADSAVDVAEKVLQLEREFEQQVN
jgi:putative two-component system response regulator